ncbi:hypothetical protein Tco_0540217 [Tanacetum coccineum]
MPPKRTATTTTTTPMTDAAIKALIAQSIADALAGYEATRNSGNGDESHEVWNIVDTAYPKSWIWRIGWFLNLDTTYWILFPSWSLVSVGTDTPYLP